MHEEAQSTERPAAFQQSVALCTRQVEKPWGREKLPEPFDSGSGNRIGEIWFEHPDCIDLPLLAKYIFTSEKLSIQVHPDDAAARQRGLKCGKAECWYILDAQPDARLGLGLIRELSAEEIRAAALDGSIEHLMDWKPVRPGDFVFVPAGTIHAIGAGISLLEFQQNVDVTYRLYDYGRPRELHLDDATQVARGGFDDAYFTPAGQADGVLVSGPRFSLLRASSAEDLPDRIGGQRRWVMPLSGTVTAGQATAAAGGCLLAAPGERLTLSSSATALVGVEGPLQNS